MKGGGEGSGWGGDVLSYLVPMHMIEWAPRARIDKDGRWYDVGNFIYLLLKN